MTQEELKFIHAINVLAIAKIDALQNIESRFDGDWQRAWNSDLTEFLPADADFIKKRNSFDLEKSWVNLKKAEIELVTIHDETYPGLLRHIAHPPFLLYVRGSKEILKSECFGVVGTRMITDYGKRAATQITQDVTAGGFTIISGLAAGIDAVAHKAAIDAGGKTIAVLGCGPDDKTIFPQVNLELAKKILKTGGAIISEYATGTHGNAFTFPQRNRIISGLSKGVLVVEADVKSGAMITAKCAVEQNRDLFCVPGNIYNRTSQGTNFMIQKGAKLVIIGQDVLDEYNIDLKKIKREIRADNDIEAGILSVLTSEPTSGNDIIRKTGLEAPQVGAALVMMELNKKIKNLGGGRFVLYS